MPQQHPNTRADSATSAPKGHILWLATALLTAQGALIAGILILPATLVVPDTSTSTNTITIPTHVSHPPRLPAYLSQHLYG
jgi:hypothetical protein